MITIRQTERRLAVIANWGLFGAFGLCLIQSGIGSGAVVVGLVGFALILVYQIHLHRAFRGKVRLDGD